MATSRVAVLGAVLLAGAAAAQCPPQRVEPPTPWYRAMYGRDVAMNNAHLVVGDDLDATLCPLTQNCGNGAVHAYRFDDGVGAWIHAQTVFASDIGPYWNFGRSVDLDADRLLVGAPASSRTSPYAGAAYVFDFDGADWVETGQIEPVEPVDGSGFGVRVAVRGNIAAIGQPKYSTAWLYAQTVAGWEFRQKLTDPPTGITDFGGALAITDDWLFIGARYGEGAVYVYRINPGATADLTQKLTAPGGEAGRFGQSVAADGATLAVGAPLVVREGLGVVHIFELDGDRWVWRQELSEAESIQLGASVAIAGDTLVAGHAPGLHIFRRTPGGGWSFAGRQGPEPYTGAYGFGEAVATDGRWAVTGAPDETVAGVESAGAAYILDLACIGCRVDLDGDGALTLFDFLTFFNLFAAGDLAADFDGDGELTLFDFLAFQDEFGAGC